jgi:hypothetical protein
MICIYLVDLERKHSKVSKTVKIVYVSITELSELIAGENLRKKSIQEVVFFVGFVVFYSMPLQYPLT